MRCHVSQAQRLCSGAAARSGVSSQRRQAVSTPFQRSSKRAAPRQRRHLCAAAPEEVAGRGNAAVGPTLADEVANAAQPPPAADNAKQGCEGEAHLAASDAEALPDSRDEPRADTAASSSGADAAAQRDAADDPGGRSASRGSDDSGAAGSSAGDARRDGTATRAVDSLGARPYEEAQGSQQLQDDMALKPKLPVRWIRRV